MAITSAGIGSGLDVSGLVKQLMAAESQPLLVLDRKEAVFQTKLSAYGSFKSTLSSFRDAMAGLSVLPKFQTMKATPADAAVFSTSASDTAVPGIYAVEVKQLAQAHKISSKAFSDVATTVGSGALTIQFGTFSGGVFTANNEKPAQTVTIDSAHSSLGGIRDAVNAANTGVSASILNDGSGYKLVFTSKDTGEANALKITVTDTSDASNTDNAGLSQLAYDPAGTLGSGKNMAETVAAQNALLKVDGIDNISKSSNTVTDVIQGVTINLLKASAVNTPTALAVTRDTGSIKSAIETFVKAYNDLDKTVKELTSYNADARKGAVLQGDSSILSVVSQIRRVLVNPLVGAGSNYSTLSQIGVSFQKDGSPALDAVKLQKAIDANPDAIGGLFAGYGKPSDSLVNYVGATDKTQPGSYTVSVSQLAAQGYKNGVTTPALAHTAGTFTAPFVVDANNDSLTLKVDGVQSSAITLAQGSYTTAAALTAEIQSKINGDAALKAAGITVAVTFDGAASSLKITSNRYGSASMVEVTATDINTGTTLGLGVGAGTAGLDVAGMINNAPATSVGRFLTGAAGDPSEGLRLEITGTAINNRGTINYSQGYAYQLDKLADKLLGSSGPISSRTEGINSSIKDLGERRDVLNRRLEEIEKRYRAQFTALDSLLGQLRNTSDFLSRQLSSLPGAR